MAIKTEKDLEPRARLWKGSLHSGQVCCVAMIDSHVMSLVNFCCYSTFTMSNCRAAFRPPAVGPPWSWRCQQCISTLVPYVFAPFVSWRWHWQWWSWRLSFRLAGTITSGAETSAAAILPSATRLQECWRVSVPEPNWRGNLRSRIPSCRP